MHFEQDIVFIFCSGHTVSGQSLALCTAGSSWSWPRDWRWVTFSAAVWPRSSVSRNGEPGAHTWGGDNITGYFRLYTIHNVRTEARQSSRHRDWVVKPSKPVLVSPSFCSSSGYSLQSHTCRYRDTCIVDTMSRVDIVTRVDNVTRADTVPRAEQFLMKDTLSLMSC